MTKGGKFICPTCGKKFNSPDEAIEHSEVCQDAVDHQTVPFEESSILQGTEPLPKAEAEKIYEPYTENTARQRRINRVHHAIGMLLLDLSNDIEWALVFTRPDMSIYTTIISSSFEEAKRQVYENKDIIRGFNVYIHGKGTDKQAKEILDILKDLVKHGTIVNDDDIFLKK